MSDDDLVNRLFRQYTQTEKRIELINLVQEKKAKREARKAKWQKLKGWFFK